MSDFRESASVAVRCPILREVLTSVGGDVSVPSSAENRPPSLCSR